MSSICGQTFASTQYKAKVHQRHRFCILSVWGAVCIKLKIHTLHSRFCYTRVKGFQFWTQSEMLLRGREYAIKRIKWGGVGCEGTPLKENWIPWRRELIEQRLVSVQKSLLQSETKGSCYIQCLRLQKYLHFARTSHTFASWKMPKQNVY